MAKSKTLLFLLSFLLSTNLYANRVIKMLFSDAPLSSNKAWTNIYSNEEDAIGALIEQLGKSSTGKKILSLATEKAQKQKKYLPQIISSGPTSICDTTLMRKFYPESPEKLSFESKSHVYINKELSFNDATLDLAHELTHYVFRPEFNPYDEKFTPLSFVTSTIEGRGGEVDAFMIECKVYQDLYPTSFLDNSNCQRIKDSNGELSRTLAIKYFYQVGKHYQDYLKQIADYKIEQESLPFLSEQDSFFISSAYGAPYPVASLQEYQIIMMSACKNESARLSHIKDSAIRNPASTSLYFEQKKQFENRCHTFLN